MGRIVEDSKIYTANLAQRNDKENEEIWKRNHQRKFLKLMKL